MWFSLMLSSLILLFFILFLWLFSGPGDLDLYPDLD